MNVSIPALLAAGRDPCSTVAFGETGPIAWAALSDRAIAIACNLMARPERRWLLACADPLDFAAGLLGLARAGKAIVVPPNFQHGTLALLGDAFDGMIGRSRPGIGDMRPRLDPAVASNPPPLPGEAPDPRTVQLVLYTSGSTGAPKSIERTLAQLEAEVAVLEAKWGGVLGSSPVLATVPHHHIYGLLFRLLWPLSAGRPFDSVTCAQPNVLVDRLSCLGPGTVVSSPAQLTRISGLIEPAELARWSRIVFCSGGPLPASAAAELGAAGVLVTEVYGSTETGGIAWRCQAEGGDAWAPLPGIEVKAGPDGTLRLRSPFVEPGGEWTATADAADVLPDGRFRLHGRRDRVVKIEEKRLSLPEMEQRLREHPWVADAGVTVETGRRQTVVAAIVPSHAGGTALGPNGEGAVAASLRAHLADFFDPVVLPRRWRFVEQLPFDDRGKLSLAALKSLFDPAAQAVGAPVASAAQEPELLAVSARSGGGVRLDLRVPHNLPCFEGHFPGFPILPGVIQVHWAIELGRKHLGFRGEFMGLERLKFRERIRPGARLVLDLELGEGGSRLRFTYSSEAGPLSSGVVVAA